MAAGPLGTAFGLIASGDPELMDIIRVLLARYPDRARGRMRRRAAARRGARPGALPGPRRRRRTPKASPADRPSRRRELRTIVAPLRPEREGRHGDARHAADRRPTRGGLGRAQRGGGAEGLDPRLPGADRQPGGGLRGDGQAEGRTGQRHLPGKVRALRRGAAHELHHHRRGQGRRRGLRQGLAPPWRSPTARAGPSSATP